MLNYSEVITRLVCDWQERKKLSQSEAAAKIGLSQTGFSRRIRGETSWSLRDIDALTAAGIALPAPTSKEATA